MTKFANGTALQARVGALRSQFGKWRAYRATVEQLSARSEAELDDLGMSRGDIPAIARAATWGAPA
ncbi:DUF1127 domain-containing protein [Roseobacter sp. HKCCA0434]|uniref:DUF1127 domain-containing protein n=1 Tax=Roseobacter sp. HKCCA0434 TaxID=3079297 RepID=UPI002905A64E|nr:DUF1127 domain-containing protein [Roseobacter sp. HKCCA0434]